MTWHSLNSFASASRNLQVAFDSSESDYASWVRNLTTSMKIGVIAIQGFFGEYEGWEPTRAADHMLGHALRAETLGFDSMWLFDHLTPDGAPEQEFLFESFVTAAAMARETRRIRIGHLVACVGFRKPALTAKMASSLDVLSGGRYELGLGAGWKEDEWRSYGYGFPSLHERLNALEDGLEEISSMLTASDMVTAQPSPPNQPRGVQKPRIPIIVGGNGRHRTWRLAARFADELNVDGLMPRQVEDAKAIIAAHCRAVGRDVESLRLSVNVRSASVASALGLRSADAARLLQQYAALGVSRVQIHLPMTSLDSGALERLAELCGSAGFEGGW
jgi:alkanesulfonate monooxygenase SsuD/methylene tetrahydromethanopterin reductase-like flavin-dependent oxidoreductase (luciferase family)